MTPRLRIWGSAVRIRSGAPFSETFRAIRTAIARRKVPMGDWAGTQADGSVSGEADYESGGREFEPLRAANGRTMITTCSTATGTSAASCGRTRGLQIARGTPILRVNCNLTERHHGRHVEL